ncbi:Bre2p PWA37_003101 [Arxiozyma heterogenica]|uniref:Bre2p n=1 Tax=Arxiozyma heterogenica TaxID=278026 RepID=UPI002EFC2A51
MIPKNPLKPGVIPYQDDDFRIENNSARPRLPHFISTSDNFYKPVDIPINKRNFIYCPCAPNPLFPQLGYCTTEYPFESSGFNLMDRSAGISIKDKLNKTVSVGPTMGWRTSRSDVCIKEGAAYWEVEVVKGGTTVPVPSDNNILKKDTIDCSPHLRFGVSRREASLEGPVGFDVYGYGIRDQGLESFHEGKLRKVLNSDQYQLKQGDVLSFILYLPQLNVQVNQAKEYTIQRINALKNASKSMKTHRTSTTEQWNSHNNSEEPATKKRQKINKNTDFHLALLEDIKYNDIIRDHIAIRYKNQLFFEATDYIKTTKPEYYSSDKRERLDYYRLDESFLAVYCNGKYLGKAFQDLDPFLPPFSELQYNEKFYSGYWRNGEYIEEYNNNSNQTDSEDMYQRSSKNKNSNLHGHKKGLLLRNKYVNNNRLGYYPTVSCFNGGEANIITEREKLKYFDVITPPEPLDIKDIKTLNTLFMEQVADDIVWDIIDEVEEEINSKKTFSIYDFKQNGSVKNENDSDLHNV